MALPADVTTFTLTFGPYGNAPGGAALVGLKGWIKPVNDSGRPVRLVHSATGYVIIPEKIAVTIGEDSTASVAGLPHTDNAGLFPTPFRYQVSWEVTSSSPSPGERTIAVPEASGPTVDFDLLVPAVGVPGVSVPLQGVPVGGTAGQVLSKASGDDFDTEWTDPAAGGTATTDASELTTGFLPAARIADASIGDVKLANGTALTAAERTKLSGIATGATVNATDAQLRDRATHTGTQAAETITGLATVATSGAYGDLSGKPTLGTAAAQPTTAFDAAGAASSAQAFAVQRANHTGTQPASTVTGLATVATTGAYSDLTGKPTIPATAADVGAQPAGSYVTSTTITAIVKLSQAAYDALGTKDAATLYVIV